MSHQAPANRWSLFSVSGMVSVGLFSEPRRKCRSVFLFLGWTDRTNTMCKNYDNLCCRGLVGQQYWNVGNAEKTYKLFSKFRSLASASFEMIIFICVLTLSCNFEIGDKKYILSDDNPTNLDATLFGHLVQFLYIPMDFPQKTFVREQCPNLVKYVDRIREEFWPDWDEMCAEKCMEGKKRPET